MVLIIVFGVAAAVIGPGMVNHRSLRMMPSRVVRDNPRVAGPVAVGLPARSTARSNPWPGSGAVQRRLQELASAGVGGGPWDQAAYHRLSRRWEFWGMVALLTPLTALVLMVYKPGS